MKPLLESNHNHCITGQLQGQWHEGGKLNNVTIVSNGIQNYFLKSRQANGLGNGGPICLGPLAKTVQGVVELIQILTPI